MSENTEWRTKTAIAYQLESWQLYEASRFCRDGGKVKIAGITARKAAEASEKARDALLGLLWGPF